MKFLITGGCGFLGANISSKLIEMGHEILVIDNLWAVLITLLGCIKRV